MSLKQKNAGVWAALVLSVALAAWSLRAEMAPAGMEVEWISVPSSAGAPTRGWVKDDLILTVSGKSLVAVRRADGYHLWQCDLDGDIRFGPSVSRANVLVNVHNNLIAIDKRGGNVRWKLSTDFIMSAEPLLIDPALYPAEYTHEWQNLESIYVPGWDSRIHAYWSRGRLATLIRGPRASDDVIAPTFDLFKQWLKANRNGAFTLTPIRLREDMLYYTADNNYIYAVNRTEGEEQEPYYMMGAPCTELTVTTGNIYCGSRDMFVYCLDRLAMRKKWSYAPGQLARGNIFADEPQTPLVYVPLEDGNVQALRITPARSPAKGGYETPEHFAEFWKVKGEGIVTAGPIYAYIGSGPVGEHAYKSVAAVDKGTGQIAWTESSAAQYLEYNNNWSNRNSGARIYAVQSDGRIVSYKEKKRDTGIQIAQLPKEAEPEQPKMPAPKKKEESGSDTPTPKPDAPKPDDTKPDAPKSDAPKPDAPKPDDTKPDAPKPDAPKGDAPKTEEKK
ncbi:MAG TPA: PQQ-binding-like beta-propeller repeat protein [Planctomycetota bacterium]|nr:PQQ-binding-like beta-propeller repeat protein [Planctomycetota bacterium]